MTDINIPENVPGAMGQEMYRWASDLFPICRSITGNGNRETLTYLADQTGGMDIHEVPSGTQCFDWVVPDEWNIRSAYLEDPKGQRVVDFADHNLHVVGYSEPIDRTLTLDELQGHLHSIPDRPDTIPYMVTYYQRNWGFCLTQDQRDALEPGTYKAVIDSTLEPGALTYGEIVLPGETTDEILLSTYICHPSLANNELSGPVVTAALAQWLRGLTRRRFTYRIIFVPETIGAIVYLSRHLAEMKERTRAGFVLSCIGDDKAYSVTESRLGGTLADRMAGHVLGHRDPDYKRYSFLQRGSDERQYCAPGIDLPVCTISRTRFGAYPEYHTSKDDLTIISPAGLEGGFKAVQEMILGLEANQVYAATVLGEPQLGRRGLISNLGAGVGKLPQARQYIQDILAYSDTTHDLLKIADRIDAPLLDLAPFATLLQEHGLLKVAQSGR